MSEKIVHNPSPASDVEGPKNISDEMWREYDFGNRVYRINNPVSLYYRVGGTTHRVVDAEGVVHCVPVPGNSGCVVRWKNKNAEVPVNF